MYDFTKEWCEQTHAHGDTPIKNLTIFWQWSHWNGFSLVCVQMCVFRVVCCEKDFWQISHWNGFSLVRVLMWSFRILCRVKYANELPYLHVLNNKIRTWAYNCPGGGHWPRKGVWGCAALKTPFSRLSCRSQGSHFKQKSQFTRCPLLRKFGNLSLNSLNFPRRGGGGAVPFWRRRVCKGQKTPFFSIAGTHRPHIFLQLHELTPKDPYFCI